MTPVDVAAICRAALGPRWLGTLDGHRCACGSLTANNGTRRLCPVCGAVYPLDSDPPVYRQGALFGGHRMTNAEIDAYYEAFPDPPDEDDVPAIRCACCSATLEYVTQQHCMSCDAYGCAPSAPRCGQEEYGA